MEDETKPCPQCKQQHNLGVGHIAIVRMACLLCRKVLPAEEGGMVSAHWMKNGRACPGSYHPGHFLDVVVWPVRVSTPDNSQMKEAIEILRGEHGTGTTAVNR